MVKLFSCGNKHCLALFYSQNGGRGWLSAAAMMEGGGVVVSLLLCVYDVIRQKIGWGQNSGCQCTYIQY